MNKKQNKSIISATIVSTFFTLLPSLVTLIGFLFFEEYIYDNFGKSFLDATKHVCIFLPIVISLLNILCIYFTLKDNKFKQNDKIITLIFSICPFISILSSAILWSSMLDTQINLSSITIIFAGLLFATIGNILPKSKQNRTFGIKIKWTLENEENWNQTHRFAGKVWFIGGLAIIITAFLPSILMISLLIVEFLALVLIPVIYSYVFYKTQAKNGTWTSEKKLVYSKKTKIIVIASIVPILIFCFVITFTGDIEINVQDKNIIVEADYWSDLTLDYNEIEKIEYVSSVSGKRISGFASSRLLMGFFSNDEFGTYTRYTYTKNQTAIIITTENGIYVINTEELESTEELFKKLKSKINE